MNNMEYNRPISEETLFRLLNEGLSDINSGKCRSAEEVFSDIEKYFGFTDLETTDTNCDI
jgi:hypothetical protein